MSTTSASPVSSVRTSDMRLRSGLAAALFLALAGAVTAAPVAGAPTTDASDSGRRRNEGDQDFARRLYDQGLIMSLELIVARARALRPGELLEVELEQKRGHHVYEVEILDEAGQTWELKFDAKDGRLLQEEIEDH